MTHPLETRATDELSEAIYHALNNPLSYVIANLVTSLRKLETPESEEAPEYLLEDLRDAMSEALDGTKRIQKTLTDLQRFSQSTHDNGSGPTNLSSAIQNALEVAWNDIRHRAHLVRDLDPSIEAAVDGHVLGRALLEVMRHIASCIPDGHASQRPIKLGSTKGDSEAQVRITFESDHASPFPSELHHLIEGFGGALLTAVSNGGDTEVTLDVPLADQIRAPEVASEAPPAPTTSTLASRVLIIDDDVLVARALKRLLSVNLGVAHVDVSTYGAHALDVLKDEEYHAVFCDVLMPDVSGMDIYERVVQTQPEVARRFVFMSGSAFTDGARDFLAEVPNPYITKPFDEDHLEVLLRKMGSLDTSGEPRLLFVDQNPCIQRSFRRSLEDDLPEVDFASDRAEATQLLEDNAYAMVFVDYDLPGGATPFIEKVRSRNSEAVLALMTTGREVQSVVDAVNLHHVSLIVHKPWKRDELNALIGRGLTIYRKKLGSTPTPHKGDKSLELLMSAIATSHPDVANHCRRVELLARKLCNVLGLEGEMRNATLQASKFYDIGKIIIPDAVLNEGRKLSEGELALVRAHVDLTDKLVSDVDVSPEARVIAREHHERWNGSGYPRGLQGTEIAVGARILGVCDSFEALVSQRPFRPALSLDEAVETISAGSGTLFDPDVVAAFRSVPTAMWGSVRIQDGREQS